jgi:hypothetical protein
MQAIARSESMQVLEGLPHHFLERELLASERATKKIQELEGYPFYLEPLTLSDTDAREVSRIMRTWSTYKPFVSPAACGGFHPDYALEWSIGTDLYRVLICFNCDELLITGPELTSHNVLEWTAYEKLKKILTAYRKNRPAIKVGE